jgi:predicted TIM-barrel fold metal-dependent hydrolase
MIIDCHIHVARQMTGFWAPLRYGRVYDQGRTLAMLPPSFDPTASPPELALAYMDQAGVDRAFLVQHHMYGDQNALVTEAITRWPDRFVGFAYLGPVNQIDGPERLERLLSAGMAGLKVELQSTRRLDPGFRFDGEREWAIWERLNSLHRPLIIDINGAPAEDVPAIQRMMDALPSLRLTICHMGGVPKPGWEERALLAQNPRVWLDLASLQAPFGPDHEYPYPREQEVIRWAVERIGVERIMWGSDYPGTLRTSTYRQIIDVVRTHCDFLSEAQKQEILAGSALRFLQT